MQQQSTVSAIVFHVKDLDATRAFYGEVLGLTFRERIGTEAGHEETFLIAESGSILLLFFPGESKPGKSPVVVFGLENGIEEVVEELVAKGVEIVLPVSEAPGGLTADFLDPDGHVLSFYQSVPVDAEQRPK